MNILIGMECSGVIRSRFRLAGHNCWSVDLKAAEDNSEFHIQGDIFSVLGQPAKYCNGHKKWDLVILHPECTGLTVSGNAHYAPGKPKHHIRLESIEFVELLWKFAKFYSHRVALENPQGVLSTQSDIGKPAQYIQPYEFGEDASKKTGLWLHNLPPLISTIRFPGRIVGGVERWSNQTDSGQNRLGTDDERATDRARTYPGIGKAIVEQWGFLE